MQAVGNRLPVLGTMYFGTVVPEKQALEIMDSYYELGGRHFDTANNYCNWVNDGKAGASELVVGEWLKRNASIRHEVTVSTKIGQKTDSNNAGYSGIIAHQALEDSMRRLRTDLIDILYIHGYKGMQLSIEECGRIQHTFREFHERGWIGRIGLSNIPDHLLSYIMEDQFKYAFQYHLSPYMLTDLHPMYEFACPYTRFILREMENKGHDFYAYSIFGPNAELIKTVWGAVTKTKHIFPLFSRALNDLAFDFDLDGEALREYFIILILKWFSTIGCIIPIIGTSKKQNIVEALAGCRHLGFTETQQENIRHEFSKYTGGHL